MTEQAVLTTHDLAVGYARKKGMPRIVKSGVSVSLLGGELVCLLGPNGVGKSTLLRTIAGMQSPLSGHIHLLGDDIRSLGPQEMARRLSIVLTDRVDVGIISVYALVALGRHPYTDWAGRITPQDEEVIRWAIQAAGAEYLAHRSMGELSDGERQKVMIARALAQQPQLMLLDEPTAFLDLPHRVDVMRTLRNLAHSTGKAILLSTHDLDLALRSADRVWLMPVDGAVQVGAPEDLILNGALQAAFSRSGIEFDAYTGSFKMNVQHTGTVELIGEGLYTLWTQRALERNGFEVLTNGRSHTADFRIEVMKHNGSARWHCISPGGDGVYTSIQDLVHSLNGSEYSALKYEPQAARGIADRAG